MKHFYSPTNGYCVFDEAPIPLGDWVEVPERPAPHYVWDGEWIPDLNGPRKAAISAIQQAADSTRTKYAMNLAFQGQAYDIKAQEADAYIAAGRPADTSAFVILTRSAAANNKTVSEWADAVLAKRDPWIAILAETEGLREEGINAIKAATTLEAIHTARDAATGALNAI